jgi:spore coat protein U-like protein
MEFNMSQSKSLLTTVFTFAIVGLLANLAAPASAMDKTTLNVTAKVTPDCKFGMNNYSLGIGKLDTVANVPSGSAFTALAITCNAGTNTASAIMLSFDGGEAPSGDAGTEDRAMADSSSPANYLPYLLTTSNSSTGSDVGVNIPFEPTFTTSKPGVNNEDAYTLNIYAYVQSTDTQIASATQYSDNVKVTVTP